MSKDEEIREKTIQSYRGVIYVCEECKFATIEQKRIKKKTEKECLLLWCIMCKKRTIKRKLDIEDIFI